MSLEQKVYATMHNYKNPWALMAQEFVNKDLSREEILTIVEIFNKNCEY